MVFQRLLFRLGDILEKVQIMLFTGRSFIREPGKIMLDVESAVQDVSGKSLCGVVVAGNIMDRVLLDG